MIYLKDILNEVVAHQAPVIKQVWDGRIPIYPALMQKVPGPVKV